MAKKAKAAAKRERKLEKDDELDELDDEPLEEDSGPKPSNEEIMERAAELHRRYDDGQMDLDTFDELRADLMGQMVID